MSLYAVAPSKSNNVIDVGAPVTVCVLVPDEIVTLLMSFVDGDVGRV